MFQTKTEQFEGPLDLLLSLIEKEKLDITQISLARITSAYLEKIGELSGDSADIADFLLIAAKLLYLKSKELIPSLESEEEEEEIADLEERLREYQAYKQAAEHFDGMLSSLNRSYSKRSKPETTATFTPPKDIDSAGLFAIFNEVMNKVAQETPEQAEIKTRKEVTLEERRSDILSHLRKAKKTSFREILSEAHSRSDVIVTFLAILEMIKQKEIRVEQTGNFADFSVCGVK